MKVKVIMLLLIGILAASCQTAQTGKVSISRKACKVFEENITLIEKFHNLEEGYSLELIDANNFLENITHLKSNGTYRYSDDLSKNSELDVKMWRNWYNQNKHLLYWDTTSNRVRVKSRDVVASLP